MTEFAGGSSDSEDLRYSFIHLGPAVQKPINANPRLKVNHEVYFSIIPQTLFNADILQNFRLEEVNPDKQRAAKETFNQKLKNPSLR